MQTETVAATDFFAASPPPPATPAPTDPEPGPTDERTDQTGAVTTSEPVTDAPATDDGGTPFDPQRHLPKKHRHTGRWMPRRPPREQPAPQPAGSEAGPGGPTDPTDTISTVGPDEPTGGPAVATAATGPAPAPDLDVCTVMAELHCRAFYGVAVAFLSDEWIPDKAEARTNRDTLAAYYRAKGIQPDSPGWALLAQLAAYAGPRVQMPKTQTRLGMLSAWVKGKFAAWRGARRAAALQSAGT